MGAGHSHDLPAGRLREMMNAPAKFALVVFLVVIGLAAAIAMAVLWPTASDKQDIRPKAEYSAPGVTFEKGAITALSPQCPSMASAPAEHRFPCLFATVDLRTGADAGTSAEVELIGAPAQSGVRVGDGLSLMRVPGEGGPPQYFYFGQQRTGFTLVMLALFVVTVLAVARWRGLFALVGLVVSGVVLVGFVLPALASGKSGLLVGSVGAVAIMFVVLYVAHGISFRTSSALAGTILGLAISTGLGVLAVSVGRLSGFVDEAEFNLAANMPGLNFRELLIAAMIIAGLGVLNDVTITQASAVFELRAVAPELTRARVFASGMRIGRDHIASTIYTIVFAYAGGALSTLLLLNLYQRPIVDLLATEQLGTEVLRTLASATGLVLSVPITTGIAALTLKPATTPEVEPKKQSSAVPLEFRRRCDD